MKPCSAKDAKDLLNDSLASDPLGGQANREAKHGDSSVQLFRKNLGGIRGVGHEKKSLMTQM